MVNNYEVLFIINPTLPEDAVRAAADKFIGLIKENGEIQEVNEWGKRRLAYPINDIQDGYYVLVYFAADPAFPAELNRRFNIDDAIMRGMVIARDSAKTPDAVSAPAAEAAEVVEVPVEAATEAPAAPETAAEAE